MQLAVDSAPWYSLDVLPPGLVHGIEWQWPGYEVWGATAVDKRGNRTCYVVKGKGLEPLPFVPDAWRPRPGYPWTWPNGHQPTPLKRAVWPRIGRIGSQSYTATEAAEVSAEMEADREAAHRATGEPELEEPPQWWRDVWRITYGPMGHVSREMAEARVLRFLILDRSIRDDFEKPRTNAARMADLKRTLADVLADDEHIDWTPPLKIMPEDHADYDTVAGWLVEALPSKKEIRLLRGRMGAPPETWDALGKVVKRSREWARTTYNSTIDALTDVANRPARRAKARLRELQARNRAFKRRG